MQILWSLAVVGIVCSLAAAAWAQPAKVEADKYKTTPSGLKYSVLKPGKGPVAVKHQQVSVHYTGWLEDGGKEFDSSRKRGEPIEFVVGRGQVIPGWDEGITGMQVGEQRQLVIPAKLGYGERGAGGVIPPNATLVFDVELVKLGDVLVPSDKPTKVEKKDLKTNPSGLQYAVLKKGDGAEARKGQTVRVHYTGWLTDGKKFDSSVDRGEAFSFPLGAGRVIKGWDEGVEGMKVGEKRQLVIPAKLGYGERGAGGVIPPNATLVFEVQLVGIDE